MHACKKNPLIFFCLSAPLLQSGSNVLVRARSRRGSVVKKRIFRFFAGFFGPKFPIWTPLLTEPLKKKVRGQRPNLVHGHKSQNQKSSYFFFGRFAQNLDFRIGPLWPKILFFKTKPSPSY